jgi:hypothetical protein
VEIGAFVQSGSQDSTPRKFTLWRVISALLLFGAGAFLIGLGIAGFSSHTLFTGAIRLFAGFRMAVTV